MFAGGKEKGPKSQESKPPLGFWKTKGEKKTEKG